ncbi:glycosyl transferase [Blyttiomyces helicus]|uniref:UDP-N-acetylglucosamine transferase subunit ALG13 n=1 Tax=Blyttiomyces helicus TaxID=388810 RepID=A0A4P9WS44_9FUNG|nr:glycosyl transferase [Blyttiomyces helicus]|eukprot:RKO94758.1 glycosyl transferase [Blyttiomyces helicus]
MYAFVTVGTTRFDALVRLSTSPAFLTALSKTGFTTLEIQHGHSPLPPLPPNPPLQITTTAFKPSLAKSMSTASLIISHGGSGSILEALDRATPLIVVVNPDLQDDHQSELARALQESGVLVWARDVGDVVGLIEERAWEGLKPFGKADRSGFVKVVEELVGFR